MILSADSSAVLVSCVACSAASEPPVATRPVAIEAPVIRATPTSVDKGNANNAKLMGSTTPAAMAAATPCQPPSYSVLRLRFSRSMLALIAAVVSGFWESTNAEYHCSYPAMSVVPSSRLSNGL